MVSQNGLELCVSLIIPLTLSSTCSNILQTETVDSPNSEQIARLLVRVRFVTSNCCGKFRKSSLGNLPFQIRHRDRNLATTLYAHQYRPNNGHESTGWLAMHFVNERLNGSNDKREIGKALFANAARRTIFMRIFFRKLGVLPNFQHVRSNGL